MKILHITKNLPPFLGGIETVTMEMAEVAASLGHEVSVVGVAQEGEVEPLHHVHLVPLRSWGSLGPIDWAPGYGQIKHLYEVADVIHIHIPNPVAEAPLLRWLWEDEERGRKVVPVIHADIHRLRPLARLWQGLVTTPLMMKSRKVIVATEQLLASSSVYQSVQDKAIIIPFSVPRLSRVTPSQKGSKTVQLIAIGRLVPYKGFSYLVKALGSLPPDLNWHLHLIGSGPMEAALLAQIHQEKIDTKVTIYGHVSEDEKINLLVQSDLVVVPSVTHQEAFGMVIAEAFAAEKPVITTDLPTGVAYLARQGDCGAVVPVRDWLALGRAIQEMLQNDVKRRVHGRRNFEFWEANLSRESFQKRYEKFLGLWGQKFVGKQQAS